MEIRYDLDDLENLPLLRQICLRLDRHFPDGESDQVAAAMLDEARSTLEATAAQLEKIGLNELAATLRELVS